MKSQKEQRSQDVGLGGEEPFRYSSLNANPEAEFEHAKWVVLTTAQPCKDEDPTDKIKIDKQGNFGAERSASFGTNTLAHQNNLPSGMIAPQKRYAHSACMAGNKMYIFAGLA